MILNEFELKGDMKMPKKEQVKESKFRSKLNEHIELSRITEEKHEST